MRKIVIAPDSFKETLSAQAVAHIIAQAFRSQLPDVELVEIPVADGGEGTLDALIDSSNGSRHQCTVHGPLGEPVNATWGLMGDGITAVIEMAAASGLALVPAAQRNPLITSSKGTGQLIRAALDAGARRFILAIGGSATNDGGAGMMRALGVQFLNEQGQALPAGGASLAHLANIDLSLLDPRLAECQFEVACDVDNPLTGENGASSIFGPQKGATPEMVQTLDAALARFAQVIREQVGRDVEMIAGAGAAGGMGAAALAFFNSQLRRGIDIVLDAAKLADQLQDADLVITGEGRLDGQTIFGKTPIGVAQLAKQFNLPVIAIGGCLREDVDIVHEYGIDAVFDCVHKAMPLEEALAGASDNLYRVARNVAAIVAMQRRLV
ncbi:glycerate kinase [Deefgea piscis]|uniref:Glycerate kinase n=1 Tax=Deefgea piscis TaxID=2739061 RepID=A0A6M8SKX9_9NEIS|nr:glycerate kinase [Deefgea piscis]QKJ65785.1 glycerate kinase [Deefgea piscis]